MTLLAGWEATGNNHSRCCLLLSAGVSQISFWPGDPEVSILRSTPTNQPNFHSHSPPDRVTEEAALDAVATEKLKSNSRPHICVLLQPLPPGLAQFISETSRECDFMQRVTDDDPELSTQELFNRCPAMPPFVVAAIVRLCDSIMILVVVTRMCYSAFINNATFLMTIKVLHFI